MHSPSLPSRIPSFPCFGHREHEIEFYSDDSFLIDSTEKLLQNALERGDGAICIATGNHLSKLAERFRDDENMSLASHQGRYFPLDVDEVLDAAVSDGVLDETRISGILDRAIQGTLSNLRKDEDHVTVFGEIVVRLWSLGKGDEALQLERLWNRLCLQNPISLRCAYPVLNFTNSRHYEIFQMICCEHGAFVGSSSFPHADDGAGLNRLLEQERQLIDLKGCTRYPRWQLQYRDALLESAVQPLFQKVEIAEAVVLTRLHELREQMDHVAERNLLLRAWRTLQIIKREILHFAE